MTSNPSARTGLKQPAVGHYNHSARDVALPLEAPLLHEFLGLELAASLNQGCTLKRMWKSKMFVQQTTYKAVMGRDQFSTIRACLCLFPS